VLKVQCFREGRELTDGSKYSIAVRGDEIRLVVRDTELSDEGKYRCEAVNKLGAVDTDAKLTMKSTQRIMSTFSILLRTWLFCYLWRSNAVR